MARKLSHRQEIFCLEYIKDLNSTRAAIRAGYSDNGAKVTGARLLTNANVAQKIAYLMEERAERTKLDADWVLQHNAAIVQADIADILEHDGRFKSPHDWPTIWRQIVSAFDIKRLLQAQSRDQENEIMEQHMKVRFVDKLKALELLGKHIDIAAYAERHRHAHDTSLEEVLERRLQQHPMLRKNGNGGERVH